MKTNIAGAFCRRTLLKAGASLGGGIIASGMPLSQAIWAAEGKVLRARANADLSKLDPAFVVTDAEVDVMHCIYSKLTRYKSGSEWGWELEAAEKIEQLDSTHIRFRLKKGIKFSGGYGEMTARDVKFSFERVIKLNSPMKPHWDLLDRVELEDDYSGVIVFKTPDAAVWLVPLPHAAGQIVSEHAVTTAVKDGGDFGMKPPAFSGPYILADWKPNQYVILTRNPDWSGPKPGFDEIRILPIPDVKAAERGYQAGDVDFTSISIDSLATFMSNPPADSEVEKKPSTGYVWIGINMDHPKLQDISVRKAIQWAINVPQILSAAYAGQAVLATGTVPPGVVGHREKALIPPEGDLAKAKEFLEKAGVKDLTLTIDCLNDSTSSTIAQTAQAQLSQIGISLEIKSQDTGSFWTLGMESEGDRWKDVQLFVMNFTGLPDPSEYVTWFTQAQVGVWNWQRFRSERYDELNVRGLSINDPNERATVYQEMQDLMEESGAFRFLTHGASPIVYRTTKVQAAMRPDGNPLYLEFQPVSG
ncbi:ABC transporter substrate-binding protein [Mesorhizobium sp.]|uniref:ABC transporter substrate-binding protein n=1 Tax=Mesorhizobium sp. TaxID=1871066 RepID=UPI00121EA309|nr:ABC transporter substrate-binding protein [Mesorhizobium sp.]TIN74618.1 MAG: peptide ABC transporter substrate-binding protein [Mesorhizobium sp.]TIO65585.1 MAG: peptide ABC transporter substrate-binding protein [Mesorhizobium sp.]TJV85501.1 MAG: peptide ABC transporter substrate-binding protein [Mesorhizobium sp.]